MQEKIREDIKQASGNEVFFVGITDEFNKVIEVTLLARGNRTSVAAGMRIGQYLSPETQQGNVVIHNHPDGKLTPSDEDVELSSFFSSFYVGSYIVNNAVDDIYVLIEPLRKEIRKKIDDEEIEHIFSRGGTINKCLASYEFRSEQMQMARQVAQCFNSEGISLIEAGTGTGKTFAYLVPSILYAKLNKTRVVVSTNTINLQEQLLLKDIPFLKKTLGIDFRATLVKGRNNYLCKRKLETEREQYSFIYDDKYTEILDELYLWSVRTRDGSVSDLNFIPENEIWEKVASESESCLRIKCPFYKECFFYKARREASTSELVIINHHLLFADMSLRIQVGDFSECAILPPFQSLIVDEAHNVEEAATSYFSRRLSRFSILRILRRLHNTRRGKKASGFLIFLEYKLSKKKNKLKQHINEIKTSIHTKIITVDKLFESFSEFFRIFFTNKDKNKSFITLTPDVLNRIEYKDIVRDNLVLLQSLLEELLDELKQLGKLLGKCSFKNKRSKNGTLAELNSFCSKITYFIDITNAFLKKEFEDHVRWLECRGRKGGGIELFFNIAPIEVKEILQNYLFQKCKTIILTSATLAVEGNLEYTKERLGLKSVKQNDSITYSELILPSSFDFRHQVFLGIFENIPAPTDKGFEEELVKLVFKTLTLTGGKAFVLFTSYALLNRLADELHKPLNLSGIALLKQGEENRHKLLSRFKKDFTSVLFGTDSFWEGVDVEGESLSNVLITRLPFQVPNDPIIEARSERIKKRGGNAFLDYFVPQAVIRFKQGFGRLIRNKNDFGTVLIFGNYLAD